MRKEFILGYDGFSGYESRCHIKILDDPNKPKVVLCSEVFSNSGTSITNAYETIRYHVLNELINQQNLDSKNNSSNLIDEFFIPLIETLSVTRAKLILIFYKISNFFRSDFSQKNLDYYWIEHYPEGRGLRNRSDTYQLVQLTDKGHPTWTPLTKEQVSDLTGYLQPCFELDQEKLV